MQEMTKMDVETLQKIIELVITLIGIILTTYVIPYLKSKYSAGELLKLKEYITLGVRCAEMYFDTTDGKAKKQYVTNYVKGILGTEVHLDITDEQLDVLIEGIVQDVKYAFSWE